MKFQDTRKTWEELRLMKKYKSKMLQKIRKIEKNINKTIANCQEIRKIIKDGE